MAPAEMSGSKGNTFSNFISQTTQGPHCETLRTGPSGDRNAPELVEDVAYQTGINMRYMAEVNCPRDSSALGSKIVVLLVAT